MERLLAFKVSLPEYPEEGNRVVFAETDEAAAAKVRAQYSDLGIDDVIETERIPEFDRYEPGPVPNSALLEAGWALTIDELGPEVFEFIKKLEGL